MTFFLSSNKKAYFASDLHLTSTSDEASRIREKDFVKWLDTVKSDAGAIFLLGDIFDFWFEYRHTIPRGYVRLFGKLAELTDSGIPVHFLVGNHDQWMRNYLSEELNVNVYSEPTEFEINEKMFLIGHGHEISPKGFVDVIFMFMFQNSFFRKLFAMLHPRWSVPFGKNWSIKKRKHRGIVDSFEGLEKELIYRHVKNLLSKKHYDFFIFGHRHMAFDVRLNENSRYINTGEWIKEQTYAVFDGVDVEVFSNKSSMTNNKIVYDHAFR